MATPTWNQLTFLTAAQQTKMAELATIGAAIGVSRQVPPDISGITYSQAKAADAAMNDLDKLIQPALRAIAYIKQKRRDDQLAAFDVANP